jgi:hypothetical protein
MMLRRGPARTVSLRFLLCWCNANRTLEKSAAFLMFLASISNVDGPGGVADSWAKLLAGAAPSKPPQGIRHDGLSIFGGPYLKQQA